MGGLAETWARLVKDVPVMETESAKNALTRAITDFRTVPNDQKRDWLNIVVDAWKLATDERVVGLFFTLAIPEFAAWLMEDPKGRIDDFVAFTAAAVTLPCRVQFVAMLATFVRSMFPDPTTVDVNLFLAVQSAIFAFAVLDLPDACEIYSLWFVPIIDSRGSIIFGDNVRSALAYFRIMHHAFFQIAVMTAPGTMQDAWLNAAHDSMRRAVTAISRHLCD